MLCIKNAIAYQPTNSLHGGLECGLLNQILDDLNRFEKYTIFRLNNRSQYALMFLAFVNMCFLGTAIEGTWVEDMLTANS